MLQQKSMKKGFMWTRHLYICFNTTLTSFQFSCLPVVVIQLHMQSVPITTKVVSSNSAHGEVYSIQHWVIRFVSDLRLGRWFSLVSSTNETDRHDITEILLKVALNTITPYTYPNILDNSSLSKQPLPSISNILNNKWSFSWQDPAK